DALEVVGAQGDAQRRDDVVGLLVGLEGPRVLKDVLVEGAGLRGVTARPERRRRRRVLALRLQELDLTEQLLVRGAVRPRLVPARRPLLLAHRRPGLKVTVRSGTPSTWTTSSGP